MFSLQAQNRLLYIAMIFSGVFLLFAALGPGLFSNSVPHPFHWQYQAFQVLCHQDALRSYHLNLHQMAVCSRCFGIYSSFFVGWILLPAFAFIPSISEKKKKILLISAILLNSMDVIGNYFSIWSNTLNSRFLLGSLLGLAITFYLAESFFKLKKSE